MKKGTFQCILGVVGLILAYSFRPPSGFGEAIMMMGSGRDFYLKEPVYYLLMIGSAILLYLGINKLRKNQA